MKLSEFSVRNSLIVNCLCVFLIFAGWIALRNTEREAFPNFSFDIVSIRTSYPGASPEVVEKRITIPLEKELKEVNDIDEMSSVSIEGMSLVIMKLDPDAPDKKQVITDIQQAVDQTRDLPPDLEDEPQVEEIRTKDTPILEVSLSGEIPEFALRQIALDLETELLDLPGVSTVARKGLRDREIWVEIGPDKLRDYHLSLSQVITALAVQNVNVPGGLLKGGGSERLLRTSGELEGPEDVGGVVIRANDAGNWVQVKDIATVSERLEEEKIIHRTDGTHAINLLVIKEDPADAIRLKEDLDRAIASFKAKSDPNLRIAFVNDFSYYIQRRLNVLVSNGWMGLLLVMIPMVAFLSKRVTLGALAGILVAVLTTFAGMQFFDISINLISMFGMIMVLGMLVDEDVVIAENTARYLEAGYPPQEAAVRGTTEVMGALISTVLTTIIAFLPLLFMTGIFGKFVSDIPKVVMITLGASLLQALFILPSHLSDLHRPFGGRAPKAMQQKNSHRHFDRFRGLYARSLKYCLDRPGKTTAVSFGITVFVFAYAALGIGFGITNTRFILFPSKGIEAFFIRAEAPVGTPIELTEKLAVPLERFVARLPENELDHYVTQVGIQQNDPNDPFTDRGSHLVQIQVFLTPESRRQRDADAIMEAFRREMKGMEGFTSVHFDPVNPGPPRGKPVAVQIRGEDFGKMDSLGALYKAELAKIAGVKDIRDDHEPGKGEYHIDVDEKKAFTAGLTLQDIGLTVRQAFEGVPATVIRKADEEIDIVVRLNEAVRHDRRALEELLVANRMGGLTPLKQVASFREAPGASVIKHLDGKRVLTVTANIDESVTTSQQVNRRLAGKFANLSRENPGYTFHYGGEAEDTEESMASLYHALWIAMLLIFMILLITFRSLLQTVVLMFTIPFGAVAIILGFAILDEPFSFLAMLGIVGLTGVVVDGGTLLFSFINHLESESMGLKEKIQNACEIRFRPIILTTATTVLGVIPAAYGIGGNDPFIRPMALAMNWGLFGSMFFTLYTIPCMYYLLETAFLRLKEKMMASRPTPSN